MTPKKNDTTAALPENADDAATDVANETATDDTQSPTPIADAKRAAKLATAQRRRDDDKNQRARDTEQARGILLHMQGDGTLAERFRKLNDDDLEFAITSSASPVVSSMLPKVYDEIVRRWNALRRAGNTKMSDRDLLSPE